MSDPVSQAVAALSRGHDLFTGSSPSVTEQAPETLRWRADQIAEVARRGGLPQGASAVSVVAADRLRLLASTDASVARIVDGAVAQRAAAERSTGVILDAARADMGRPDSPAAQQEQMRRMIERLRAQRGIVVRSRAQARVLALRLRRAQYQRDSSRGALGRGVEGSSGVRAAISAALTRKGIMDRRARANWMRGMHLVADRESDFQDKLNGSDSNARKGMPSGGVFQFVRPTFEAYWEPGTPREWRNTYSQACAFINYAVGHYGVALDGSNLAARIQQADPTRAPKGY